MTSNAQLLYLTVGRIVYLLIIQSFKTYDIQVSNLKGINISFWWIIDQFYKNDMGDPKMDDKPSPFYDSRLKRDKCGL